MKARKPSSFRDPAAATAFLERWNEQVQELNGFRYEKLTVTTMPGKTVVWAANRNRHDLPTVVFFPGARTCGLFWDLDNAQAALRKTHRIFIVDVNGQPSLSAGQNPVLQSPDYGVWAAEVLQQLEIRKATIAGASLGGIICLKLCLQAPEKVERAILFNPAGFQGFSMKWRNFFYNMLSIIVPTEGNLQRFLAQVVFHYPQHQLPPAYHRLLSDYLLYALREHRFKGDYPAPLPKEELQRVQTPVYMVLGDQDPLFPYQKTMQAAQTHLRSLQEIKVLSHIGHGIETAPEAHRELLRIVQTTPAETITAQAAG